MVDPEHGAHGAGGTIADKYGISTTPTQYLSFTYGSDG
jgi:hypothetical protein